MANGVLIEGTLPALLEPAIRLAGCQRIPKGSSRVSDLAGAIVVTRTARRRPAFPASRRTVWMCHGPVGTSKRIDAVRHGAYDVISLTDSDAPARLRERLSELAVPMPQFELPPTIVVESAASRQVIAEAAQVASTSMSVLLTGETGTGKEVMARLLHAWSPRSQQAFVAINCAAIPDELMEAELFGYARGAFSGAVQRYDGQLAAAEGGTVFLDEIDETPLETQVKLLRVLEDRMVNRLGENVWREVDFRLIAASNRALEPLIAAGLFGSDLYARLAIVRIDLAPLRERVDDLPALARHFIERFAREQHRPACELRDDTLRALAAYSWPGNIRELRNVLYQTLVYKRAGTEILPSDLPPRILARPSLSEREAVVDRHAVASKIASGRMSLREEVAILQKVAIEEALQRSAGNAAQAARLLGKVGRGTARDPGSTMRAMMRRLKTGR
jgi:DNA-binding NtrC family response regulator